MKPVPIRCLVLACGNTLRSDDGVGPWLAAWAAERFRAQAGVRVIARQQWTPDLAEDVAHAESVLFIDCSIDSLPGMVKVTPVERATSDEGLATHHQSAGGLLKLAHELYAREPQIARLLTIGAGSTDFGEAFSDAVKAAILGACSIIELALGHIV